MSNLSAHHEQCSFGSGSGSVGGRDGDHLGPKCYSHVRLKFLFARVGGTALWGGAQLLCVAAGMGMGGVAIFLWGRGQIPSASRSSNRQ
jgi:hypothetical protein